MIRFHSKDKMENERIVLKLYIMKKRLKLILFMFFSILCKKPRE